MKHRSCKFWASAWIIVGSLFSVSTATAGTIVPCGGAATCSSSFSVFFNGSVAEVGGGQFLYDATTGQISLDTTNIRGNGMATAMGGIMWTMGDGSQVTVKSLSGNADPLLSFGLGASTQSIGRTFGFSFDLPIALSGPIQANSSVAYSMTSTTQAGAQLTAINGKVVTANEVDTTVGGKGALNMGVDVGDTFFFTGGPQVQNSPVYAASNAFAGDLAYDLMSVQINFGLSANSVVGMSGFVQQVAPVPVPAAFPLLLSGIVGLGALSRRNKRAHA